MKLMKLLGDLFVTAFLVVGLVASCSRGTAASTPKQRYDLVLGMYSSANGHRIDYPSYDYVLHIPEPTDAVCEFAGAGTQASDGKQTRNPRTLAVELVDWQCLPVRP